MQSLYPRGALSRFQHRVLGLLGFAYFSKSQLAVLEQMRVLTETFLEAFEGQQNSI